MDTLDVSRWQFGITTVYHFILVPLTIGLAPLLAVMQTIWVVTGNPAWYRLTKFFGKLFLINFALGVVTGIVQEFQFGMNWSYYSHYVGDIFGAPLAIEGLMAFFMEATFVGLFFFGWDRLSKVKHLIVTCLMAIGTNFSALWILVANGWMQNPVGATFNPQTMRMEVNDFFAVLTNPVAQAKFVHTVSAGYVMASLFVLGISAWYLLGGRHVGLARRSITVAASFGLAGALSVVVLGDESGYVVGEAQQTKMAAIEAMWETEPAPASFNLVANINQAEGKNDWSIQIPYVMGIIGTRSLDKQIMGIHDIIKLNEQRIINGQQAVVLLEDLRNNPNNALAAQQFEQVKGDLGFGLLLKKYTDNVGTATPEMIAQAAKDTIPPVFPIFWSFRAMVGLGFLMLALFVVSLWSSIKGNFLQKPWLLRWALFMLPAPWLAAEFGWFIAEYGRQPWTIYGMLPTHLSVSNLSVTNIWMSLAGFVGFYTILLIVEMYLMIKYVKLGPASLGTGRYDGETPEPHITLQPTRQSAEVNHVV